MNPELTGAAAPKAAAPKKKSNAGLIIAIIVAALIIAGGAVAAVIILNNNNGNNGGSSENGGTSENGGNNGGGETKISNPYKSDSAYFVKIGDNKYTFENKLGDLSESGYEISKYVTDKTVPAGKYMIMIGGGTLTNSKKGSYMSITPYNDGGETVKFADAKLGKVNIRKSSISSVQEELASMEFYGGIHLGSTLEELKAAFGEPTDSHDYSSYEQYEYQDKTFKKFEFQIEDGVITEITWTNYGGLNN